MTREFPYRAPMKYLYISICMFLSAFIFGYGFEFSLSFYTFAVGIMIILTLISGIAFMMLFSQRFKGETIRLDGRFLELPVKWSSKAKIELIDIVEIGDIDKYDHLLEISTYTGVYVIEKAYMVPFDFEALRSKIYYWYMDNR